LQASSKIVFHHRTPCKEHGDDGKNFAGQRIFPISPIPKVASRKMAKWTDQMIHFHGRRRFWIDCQNVKQWQQIGFEEENGSENDKCGI
jgi:hypothetical protein